MRLDEGLCADGIRAGEGTFDGTGADSMSDVTPRCRLVNSSSSDIETHVPRYTAFIQPDFLMITAH